MANGHTPLFNAFFVYGDNLGSKIWRAVGDTTILAGNEFEVQYWWIEDDSGSDDDWILRPDESDDLYKAVDFATMEGSHSKTKTSGNGNVSAWYTITLLPLTGY